MRVRSKGTARIAASMPASGPWSLELVGPSPGRLRQRAIGEARELFYRLDIAERTRLEHDAEGLIESNCQHREVERVESPIPFEVLARLDGERIDVEVARKDRGHLMNDGLHGGFYSSPGRV